MEKLELKEDLRKLTGGADIFYQKDALENRMDRALLSLVPDFRDAVVANLPPQDWYSMTCRLMKHLKSVRSRRGIS